MTSTPKAKSAPKAPARTKVAPPAPAVVKAPVKAPAPRTKHNWNLGDRVPLKLGVRGHDVRVLQDYLTRAGEHAKIDGEYGKSTRHAVRMFELAQQLKVDGTVTAAVVTALRDVVQNGGAVAASTGLGTGGTPPTDAQVSVLGPGLVATIGPDKLAIAPALAPPVVQQVIAAGNRIATLPYRYGGGHGNWTDSAYDCSGSVSFALHGGGLLDAPMASGDFMNWGDPGPGTWITIYAHGSHMYMVIAGLRFDTSGRSAAGTRWQADMRSGDGYAVRHPPGY